MFQCIRTSIRKLFKGLVIVMAMDIPDLSVVPTIPESSIQPKHENAMWSVYCCLAQLIRNFKTESTVQLANIYDFCSFRFCASVDAFNAGWIFNWIWNSHLTAFGLCPMEILWNGKWYFSFSMPFATHRTINTRGIHLEWSAIHLDTNHSEFEQILIIKFINFCCVQYRTRGSMSMDIWNQYLPKIFWIERPFYDRGTAR